MQKITLLRSLSDPQGTIGLMAGIYTLELPWHDNEADRSCIPEGTYQVHWTRSPRLSLKHGTDFYTYEILGVPGRGGIRIHGGNFAGDKPQFLSHSLGCPLLGMRVGRVNGQRAVLASQMAVRKFENMLQRKNFILEVKNA